jgi:hypothetical protein
MRGTFEQQGGLFSHVSPETRVPADHPLAQDPWACAGRAEGAEPVPPLLLRPHLRSSKAQYTFDSNRMTLFTRA